MPLNIKTKNGYAGASTLCIAKQPDHKKPPPVLGCRDPSGGVWNRDFKPLVGSIRKHQSLVIKGGSK